MLCLRLAAIASALALGVVLPGGGAAAQGKPDFSGTWRPIRMEAGGRSTAIATTQQDMRIAQDAATLTIFHPPDGSLRTVYKLDGSPSTVPDGVARASWVGATLVVESTLGDDKIKTKDVFALDATGSLVAEATAPPPLGSGSPARIIYKRVGAAPAAAAATPRGAAAASSSALPPGFAPPAGFALDEKASKTYDFSHEPMSYPTANGGRDNRDPEGRTWSIFLTVTPPNKTGLATDASIRAALKAQGWTIDSPSGTLIAHRVNGGKTVWWKGAAFSGEYRATVVEVGPAPHALTLTSPANAPETVADTADFPYLQRFPGSTLKKTTTRTGGSLDASVPGGAHEQLVGSSVVQKDYDLPASVSTYEFMVVYRDALTKAGWTVLRTAASSDALVVAHYAKNGRDVYAYLHGNVSLVADIGAENDTKALAAALAKSGHVAIYGIYFDVDQATLRPESTTALQHVLDLLNAAPTLALELQGHTDNTGAPARNQTLSEARAASVKTWLVAHGVAASRLTPKGYGDTQPVADNKTPEGRAKNRRVELKTAGPSFVPERDKGIHP